MSDRTEKLRKQPHQAAPCCQICLGKSNGKLICEICEGVKPGDASHGTPKSECQNVTVKVTKRKYTSEFQRLYDEQDKGEEIGF
jgi:hypothetical protein